MKRCLIIAPVVLVLAACGTPKVVMEQANHSVSLVADLEQDLKAYRKTQQRSQDYMTATLAQQLEGLNFYQAQLDELQVSLIASDVSGKRLGIQKRLNTLSEEVVRIARSRAPTALYEEKTRALLTPLPSTQETTTAAQEALLPMSKELSRNVRGAELIEFAKSVKKSVDEARDSIEKAEQKADSAQ